MKGLISFADPATSSPTRISKVCIIEFVHGVDDYCVATVEPFNLLRIIAIYGIPRCGEIDQDIDIGHGKCVHAFLVFSC